MNKPLVERWRN